MTLTLKNLVREAEKGIEKGKRENQETYRFAHIF
jgi:hypothetical protein